MSQRIKHTLLGIVASAKFSGLLSALLLTASFVACPDAVPEHVGCKTNSDCPDGQSCNVNTNVCVGGDAGLVTDANGLGDALVDTDSGTDAAQPNDAATADDATTDNDAATENDAATGDDAGQSDASSQDVTATDAAENDAASSDAASADHAEDNYYAVAGDDQHVDFAATVNLDASASVLPSNATNIEYLWTLTQKPQNSTAQINAASAAQAVFVPNDAHGEYTITLTITVDGNALPTDSLQVFVNNRAPVAEAGDDAFVKSDATLQLDGTGSSDPDDDTLTYHWALTDSALGSFDDADSATPTFTPAADSSISSTTVTLTVTDPDGDSGSDTLTLTVQDNLPPTIVLATNNFSISHSCSASACSASGSSNSSSDPGTALAATVSDEEGDSFDTVWSLKTCPDGSAANNNVCTAMGLTVTYDDDSAQWTDFVINGAQGVQIAGTYIFVITASDDQGNVSTAEVTVTVENTAPTGRDGTASAAHGREDSTYFCKIPFSLDVDNDADGDSLTVTNYSLVAGELRNQNGLDAEFYISSTSPNNAFLGPYSVIATVEDGQGGSLLVTMTLSCTNSAPEIESMAPTASHFAHGYDAGNTLYNANYGAWANTVDAEGDLLTCTWSAVDNSAGVDYHFPGSLTPDGSGYLSLDQSMSDADYANIVKSHGLRLTCSDVFGQNGSDTTYFTVTNSAPVAQPGNDAFVKRGHHVTLDGTGSSDPNQDPMTYLWELSDTSIGSFDDSSSATPVFTSDGASSLESVTVTMTVTDAGGESSSDYIMIYVQDNLPPTVSVTTPFSISHSCSGGTCSAVQALTATVVDEENDAFTLQWKLAQCADGSRPSADVCDNGVSAVFVDATAEDTSVTLSGPDSVKLSGSYYFTLTATETRTNGGESSATARVTVQNTDPNGNNGTASAAHGREGDTYYCRVPFTLDVSDADNDSLEVIEYAIASGAGEIRNRSGLSAEFLITTTSPDASLLGPYTIVAAVQDGQGGDIQVNMTVSCSNSAPQITNTVTSRSVGHKYNGSQYVSEQYLLPATVSDDEGDAVTCTWSATPSAGVTFHGLPETLTQDSPADFELNEYMYSSSLARLIRTHHLNLDCEDVFGGTASYNGDVLVTNRAPVVEAGRAMNVYHVYNASVSLQYYTNFKLYERAEANQATAVDPDDDPLDVQWALTSDSDGLIVTFDPRPAGSENPYIRIRSDDINKEIATHVVQMTASDGLLSDTGALNLTALNHVPTVDAGGDISRYHIYDSSSSYFVTQFPLDSDDAHPDTHGLRALATASDVDHDPLTYRWSKPAGAPQSYEFNHSTDLNPSNLRVYGDSDAVGDLQALLVVNDGDKTNSDTLNLHALNHAPVANNDALFVPIPVSVADKCNCDNNSQAYCRVSATGSNLYYSTAYSQSFSDEDGDPMSVALTADIARNRILFNPSSSQTGDGSVNVAASVRLYPLFNSSYFDFSRQATWNPDQFYDTATITATYSDGFSVGRPPSVDNDVQFKAIDVSTSCF